MRKTVFRCALVISSATFLLQTNSLDAGIAYGDPDGGWAYTYEGVDVSDDPIGALDGDWTYGGGSDSWDGSGIGDDAPGGVSALKDGDTTFIRIQDTGDPRDYPDESGIDADPSNRKIFFDREIVELDGINDEFLEDGFTFSFRGRISTGATGPIDPWYPDGGGGSDDWPEGGLGEHVIEFDSTAHISLFQPGNIGSLGFALTTEEGEGGVGENGFLLNDLTDDIACQNCGDTGAGDLNHVAIENINEWQEFWVTIGPSEGPGSHKVNVYLNGSEDGMEFDVTAGVRSDGGGKGPLSIGIPGTSKASAWDLDFISIANGIHAPSGAGGVDGDFDDSGVLDVADINLLVTASASNENDAAFELTGDNLVNSADVKRWIKDLANSWIGDADLNGEFNSGDLVRVFQAGKFETGQPANWQQGDWDGDGVFGSSDFVSAFQDGGFERGPRATQAVPEPQSVVLLLCGLLSLMARRRN